MSFSLSTDTVLDAIRDTLGATVAIGTAALTWARALEGDPLRWATVLDDTADYPCYIMRPEETTGDSGPALKRLTLGVTVHVMVRHQDTTVRTLSPKAYKAARLVGEACVAKLEDAGHHLGTTACIAMRRFVRAGVDYDLTESVADHGLAAYSLTYEFDYYAAEV